ncbi:MAG TPA: bifunctional diaminohydroxyphosphoribosylaminopyrimidine deaminase/5-amino-6-(5-phosphoribosylamino)uracil reductase RibD [Longimicrobiales bacterium]|nr:bifunctional diaminohydroxyphosphoribosylaminopyrimidine deaminase/5-amino-6-(5-phosphoribosylamino)uracil reductase RibD [Longimicrobiales bacterium]
MSTRPVVVHARPIEAAIDARYMDRALALAARGWGRVQPNPLVGAVVVDVAGNVVGEGWHAAYGEPHAEAEALSRAGAAAAGGTLYVTLEPCAHQGNTPPCTDAVLRSGIARLVVALRDPNPVAAGGLERIAEAGVEVATGVREEEAADQNAAFLHWHRTGTPYVALKYGMSLDARLGTEVGQALEVTGVDALAEVQRLRAGFDAIMVGSRTALIDDPRLTVRGEVKPRRPPIRVVLDSDLRLSPESRLAAGVDRAPSWVFCAPDAPGNAAPLEARGVRVERARRAPGGGLDLEDVMQRLAAADVRSVLCEGGGRLGAALLSADLVARQYVFMAPVLLGEQGPPAFPAIGGQALARRWRAVRSARFGDDILLELARD